MFQRKNKRRFCSMILVITLFTGLIAGTVTEKGSRAASWQFKFVSYQTTPGSTFSSLTDDKIYENTYVEIVIGVPDTSGRIHNYSYLDLYDSDDVEYGHWAVADPANDGLTWEWIHGVVQNGLPAGIYKAKATINWGTSTATYTKVFNVYSKSGTAAPPGVPTLIVGNMTKTAGARAFDYTPVGENIVAVDAKSSKKSVASVKSLGTSLRIKPKRPGQSKIKVTASGPDGSTVTESFILTVKPQAPKVKIRFSGNTMTFSWSRPKGSKQFQYKVSRPGSGGIPSEWTTITSKSGMITPGTKYYVYVRCRSGKIKMNGKKVWNVSKWGKAVKKA